MPNDELTPEVRLTLIHLGRVDLAIAGYRLIVITGPPRSGKTTLANQIAMARGDTRQITGKWINWRNTLMELKHHDSLVVDFYGDHVLTSDHLHDFVALENPASNRLVIITADALELSTSLERHALRFDLPPRS